MNVKEELERIWNKWTNLDIDDTVQSLCHKEAEPISILLMDLYSKILERDIKLEISANQLGEDTGRALGKLTRCAFMVGLEYPFNNELEKNFFESEPFTLLEEASSSTKGILVLFIGILVENRIYSMEEGETNAQLGGSYIYRALIGCYSLGVKYYQSNKNNIITLTQNADVIEAIPINHDGDFLPIKRQLITLTKIKDQFIRDNEILRFIKTHSNIEPVLKTLLLDPDNQLRSIALDVLSKIELSQILGE